MGRAAARDLPKLTGEFPGTSVPVPGYDALAAI